MTVMHIAHGAHGTAFRISVVEDLWLHDSVVALSVLVSTSSRVQLWVFFQHRFGLVGLNIWKDWDADSRRRRAPRIFEELRKVGKVDRGGITHGFQSTRGIEMSL